MVLTSRETVYACLVKCVRLQYRHWSWIDLFLSPQSIHNAHSDCINFVRFLDTRVFATCSDDTQVALWDVRNLKSRMRTLEGHSNWVKNIEYAQDKG